MEFKRTKAINKIRSLKKRKKAIQGGTSAGKTIAILSILIDEACKNPGLEVSVVSESVPHLKRGALRDFLKIMKQTGRFIESNYNKTDRIYRFTNGSFMEFFSPESILGARRDVLYINECNKGITFSDYHQLAIRTRKEIYMDWNPSAEFWFNTELQYDEDVDFLILTYKDNEALEKTIVDDIEKAKELGKTSKYWENWWNVYGLGQMGTVDGVVFGEFKAVDSFPADCKWIIYGMDFGFVNDPTTLIKIGMKDGELFYQQMIWSTGLLTSDIDRAFKELNVGRTEVIADLADQKSITELAKLGWNIKKCEKPKGSVNYGLDLMKQYKTNIVKDSIDFIKEWRGYSYEFDKALNKYTNTPVDTLNHGIDASRYALTHKLAIQSGGFRAHVRTR